MAQFTGGPSVRVSANASVEFKWLTDVAWFGKLEVFTTADGTGNPVLTKNCEDGAGNPMAASQQMCTVPVVGVGLQADTQYFFKVTAIDPTKLNPDLVTATPLPPVFSGTQMISSVTTSFTTNGATVAWQSNVPGLGKVAYGTGALTQSVQDGFNISAHALDLLNLQPGTTYQFQVSNRHAIDGDDLVTATGQFTTASLPSTTTVSFTEPHAEPRVINPGQTSAVSVRTKDGNGAAVPGVQVTFAIDPSSAGSGTLSATSATTNGNGIATVTFTGSSRGLVKLQVTAANASNSPHQIPVVVK